MYAVSAPDALDIDIDLMETGDGGWGSDAMLPLLLSIEMRITLLSCRSGICACKPPNDGIIRC